VASGPITRLISAWQSGDPLAENALFDALYETLHRIALERLRIERSPTLGPTALVHEAFLRFRSAERLTINNSQHFLFLAGRVMRRILVDRARARLSQKRGRDIVRVELVEQVVREESDADEIIAVDRALADLAKQSPRQAQLVELRYFGGLSEEETAGALGISARTVRREWQLARTRLKIAITGAGNSAEGLALAD
jgi:RNA polymerase sigma factor (TIGR02999 family)